MSITEIMTFPDENGGMGYVDTRENANTRYTVKQAYENGELLVNFFQK